jgi:Fe-S-cluster containining protein
MQACRRCGKCCLADFRSYVTAEDFRRWQREERKDILNCLEGDRVTWSGDHFVSPDDGKSLNACSFLMMVEGRYGCSIYATRPATCRRFHPGGSELCPQYGL